MRNLEEVDGCGFEYALDFHWKFNGKKTWFTAVRRRRWIRIRRLIGSELETQMEPHSEDVSRKDFIFNVGHFCHSQKRVDNGKRLFTPLYSLLNNVNKKRRSEDASTAVRMRNISMLDLFKINENEEVTQNVPTNFTGKPKLAKYRTFHNTDSVYLEQKFVHHTIIRDVKALVTLDIRNVLVALSCAYFDAIVEILEPLAETSVKFNISADTKINEFVLLYIS